MTITPQDLAELTSIADALDAIVTGGNNLITQLAAASMRIHQVISVNTGPTGIVGSVVITDLGTGVPLSSQSLAEAATYQLDTIVTDTAGFVMTGQTIAWTSSASGIVTVGASTGLLTGVAAGTATITASTGGGVTSTPATVTVAVAPTPVALLWGTQPSGMTTGSTMVSCTVRVVDNANATVPAATNAVALTLVGSGGVLTGTTTVNAVAGVATFSALIVTGTGTYSFSATSGAFPAVLSSSFTISAILGSAWPNQPAGYTPFLGANGKVLVSGATQITQTTIAWKDASTYTPPTTTLGVSLAAPGVPPTGDTNLAQITLPYHYTSGSGHGQIYETPNLQSLSAKRLYMACYAKVSENWYGEGTGILKFFQPLTGTTLGTNRIILSIHGAGNATLKAKLGFQFGATGGVINGVYKPSSTAYYSPAGSTGTIVRGQWHLYELLVIANTAGNADGTVQAWLDGVQTHGFIGNNSWDSTGFSWQNAQIQSVYGGGTMVNAVPDDQYIWIASPFFVSTHV